MKKSILFIWCILSAATAQPIKRIVSLSPAIDYHLMALEADSLIVGATVYSPLEEAARIGDVLTVNIESLVALRPDIVLTTPITPAGKLAMIRKLNIPLRVIDKPRSYSDLCRQFREVARAAGYKKQADSLITVYNTKVHAVRDKNRSRDRIPMFFQIGRDPLYTVTKHSFIHDYMDFCGAQNIAADAPSGRISREAVIEGKPGIIIVTEMGGSRQHPLHAWKSYKSIPAVQEEAVYSVNTAKACSPNLPMFYDLLTELDSLVNSRR